MYLVEVVEKENKRQQDDPLKIKMSDRTSFALIVSAISVFKINVRACFFSTFTDICGYVMTT